MVQELQQAELEQDFNDIRTELTEGGYLRGRGKKQPRLPAGLPSTGVPLHGGACGFWWAAATVRTIG